MVLLESISAGEQGLVGTIEGEGREVALDGVPLPSAIGGLREDGMDAAMERLKNTARNDSTRYYFIEDEPYRDNDVFAIGYFTFMR